MKPITMTLDSARTIFLPDLRDVTIGTWSDEDYEDDPDKKTLAADVEAGVMSIAVLTEIENCLTRDWCRGPTLRAALVILAAHGRLDEHDPKAVTSRRPRTTLINGVRYVTG